MRGLKRGSEDEMQGLFIQWVRYMEGQHPALNQLYAIGNGGKRPMATAMRMKMTGTRKGVLDLHLPVPSEDYHGLWIEFKLPDGKLKPEQSEFAEKMRFYGHRVEVCTAWTDAADIVIDYLGLTVPKFNA